MKITKGIVITLAIGLVVFVFNNQKAAALFDEDADVGKSRLIGDKGVSPYAHSVTRDGEQQPAFVPGEIVVKFRTPEELERKVSSLEMQKEYELASRIRPEVTTNLRLRIYKEGNLLLTGMSIKKIRELPEEIRSLIKEQTTLGPVFESLHRMMRAQGKTEEEIVREKFNKFSRERKMPTKEPKNYNLANIYILKNIDPQGKSIKQICQELSGDPNVEYAEPNYICKVQAFPLTLPNDTYVNPSGDGVTWSTGAWGQPYEDMWGLKNTQAYKSWFILQGEGVIVAVVDTGIDYNHPDIWDNVWVNPTVISDRNGDGKINLDDADLNGNHRIEPGEIQDHMFGWDFIGKDSYNPKQDNDPKDGYGHGTHCAGTIAATGNNAKGVIGVAPKAKVMAVKGLDDAGYGSYEALAQSLCYAVDSGARVINCSWGGGASSELLLQAIDYAFSNGCVTVVAAGNSGGDAIYQFPACVGNVITVAAVDQNDKKCYFSNWGEVVDVSAPGGGEAPDVYNILSLLAADSYYSSHQTKYIVGSNYLRNAGTSMAAPHVSGLAALVISKYPDYSCTEVENQIAGTTDKIDALNPHYEGLLGTGRINTYRALTEEPQLFPAFITVSSIIDDDCQGESEGNGNGAVEQGEIIEFTVVLKNIGRSIATGVEVSLTTDDPNVKILEDTVYFGDIPIQTESRSPEPFLFEVEVFASQFSSIKFVLDIRSTEGDDTCTTFVLVNIKIEGPIYTHDSSKYCPDIWGERIVWSDYIENDEEYVSNIYMYDLSTKEEIQITTNPPTSTLSYGDVYAVFPVIYGDRIAWEDRRNPDDYSHIYMYDLSTKKEIRITPDLPQAVPQYYPDIYGDKIVWQDHRHFIGPYENPEIYMYDIPKAEETRITWDSEPIFQCFPAIYGDKIVWHGGSFDSIYMYDLIAEKEIEISSQARYQYCPEIYGDKIVWQGFSEPDGCYAIYMYDLSKGQEIKITNIDPNMAFCNPVTSIYGDKIVWQDFRSGNGDIYLYDLSTKQEIQITSDSMDEVYPVIYGNRIVWQGYSIDRGVWDIYTATICTAPNTTITAGPTGVITTDDVEFSWTGSDDVSEPENLTYAYYLEGKDAGYSKFGSSTTKTYTGLENKTYTFYVKAKDEDGNEDASPATRTFTVQVSKGEVQYPWKDNAYGALYTDVGWNYTMGYKFTPKVNGKVTQLGGYFKGTKKVYLYDAATQQELATVDVTSSNNWSYSAISSVDVIAGKSYIVAVYLAGSGGSCRYLSGSPLPKVCGDIQIETSMYNNGGDSFPWNSDAGYMYGQADIEFVPGQGGDTTPPDTNITKGPTEGETLTTNSVTFEWTGSDDKTALGKLQYAYYLEGVDAGYGLYSSENTKTYQNLANKSYKFYVKAKDEAGNEDASPATRSFTVSVDTTPPVPPTNLRATAGDKQVDLDWDDNKETDLAGYWVYRSMTQGGPYTQITPILILISSYKDTTVENGKTYYYVVTAQDISANESKYSNEVQAIPLSPTGDVQHPAEDYGSIIYTFPWYGTTGYRFTPKVNGKITQLGGYSNGAKRVYLWDTVTAKQLASTVVTFLNGWGYVPISPVDVIAGKSYTVGIYFEGVDGVSYWMPSGLPTIVKDITIECGVYAPGGLETIPQSSSYDYVYGADIEFVPGQGGDTTPPDTNITQGPTEGETLTTNSVTFEWTGSDDKTAVGKLQYAYYLEGVDTGYGSYGSETTKTYQNLANKSYKFYVKAKDEAGNEDLSPATRTFTVQVSKGEVQYPWKDNEHGQLYTDGAYDYTWGYKFTPKVNGKVTQLGGCFKGTRKVYLYDAATQQKLATVEVTSNNNWSYSAISPIEVFAGRSYIVAVYSAGSGATWRSPVSLSQPFGDIQIECGVYYQGDTFPIYSYSLSVYGQADIEFVPG